MNTMTSTYPTAAAALDAEREAILACAAATYAVPAVQEARDAHLAGVQAELVNCWGFTR